MKPGKPPRRSLTEAEIEGVHDLLDDGNPAEALNRIGELAGVDGLAGGPMPLPALAIEALLAADDIARAERVSADALRAHPGDPELLAWRSGALYNLWRFSDAADAARKAVTADAEYALAHHALGLALDHLGKPDDADRHFAAAQRVEPDAFRRPVTLSRDAFDAVVQETLAEIRQDARLAPVLEEVAVVVEDLPGEQIHRAGAETPDLLGFFAGRALPERAAGGEWGQGEGAPHPGTLYLFRRNLARTCADRAELASEIRITVLHELAHLLGFDEDEMHDLGLE